MSFLFTIFGFLLIFSLYAGMQMYRLITFTTLNQVYEEHASVVGKACAKACDSRARYLYSVETKQEISGCEEEDYEREEKPTRNPRLRLSRKLHISALLQSQALGANNVQFEALKGVFKNLLYSLYSKKTFFQEALQENPHSVDQLIDAVLQAASQQKITLTEQLANLQLEDASLQNLLYNMLVGKKSEQIEDEDVVSLLQCVSLQKRPQVVCAYLAPREILQAVFQNEDLVSEIIVERNKIYREVSTKKKADLAQWSLQFRNRFVDKVPSTVGSALIEFRVTTTEPSSYRGNR